MNLTTPLKHQLDSGAVGAIDTSMTTKSVNVLRWDGRGWWCAGVDGEGVRMVLHHHGFEAKETVLGLCGGGGAARSTASTWAESGGQLHVLPSRRELDVDGLAGNLSEQAPGVLVDFDGTVSAEASETLLLKAAYEPMEGSFEDRIAACSSPFLDGRWLLVAQHLACWRHLWAPEHAASLPSLGPVADAALEGGISPCRICNVAKVLLESGFGDEVMVGREQTSTSVVAWVLACFSCRSLLASPWKTDRFSQAMTEPTFQWVGPSLTSPARSRQRSE